MNNQNPIGIFDSGIGGTSIWREIHHIMPNEDTIYLADSKNAPYGQKSKEEIIDLCIKNTELLLQLNCKIIVVACNTATTNAIKELRAKYSIPFIGIEPAIKPAANQSKTQTIGILATQGTLNSELFIENLGRFQNTKIIEQVGHGLVQLIEAGKSDSEEINILLKSYLDPMIQSGIDYLVLGCSHYPYLIPQIKKIVPENIKIIDSGEAVAKQTKKILENIGLNKKKDKGNYIFYSNSGIKALKDVIGNDYLIKELQF
jgi:glutamate racemase